MILDPLDIPDELLEAQEQGTLVVFVGAGASRGAPSNLPDFRGLAAEVAKGTPFENEIAKNEQRLDRCFGEMMRAGVDIQHLVRQRIGDPASSATDLHRWIVDLFPDPKNIRIVTSNFDPHFTAVLRDRKIQCDQYYAPALPRGHNFRGLVYLHGSILREEDSLILSDEDFGRAYMTEGWARGFLRGMFDRFTTLFIGYSHTDPPVEYLARGMSAIRVAPRYALVSEGEEGWWTSLKVKPILFKKPGGPADFSELGRGLSAWARFSKDQPTDVALKVRDILCSPSETEPAQSQSSLLLRCLARKDACHFFTGVAEGWRWVEWANKQGSLKPLFRTDAKESSETQWEIATWLAKALIAEKSEKGLLLVAEHGGVLGRDLWIAMCRHLWTSNDLDYNSPLLQKWVSLLIGSCPEPHKSELGHLLQKVVRSAPRTLGLVLFRFLTTAWVVVSSGWTFAFGEEPGTFTTSSKADFDLVLVGESYHLEDAWETGFKPLICELAEEYIRLLSDRLQEMYGLFRAAERADERQDPWCLRDSILQRDAYRRNHDNSLVVDFLIDVVETISKEQGGISIVTIENWTRGSVPTLLRIGLLALFLSEKLSAKEKVEFLSIRKLLYPAALGSGHEVYSILAACYPELTPGERAKLWQSIDEGPIFSAPDSLTASQWSDYCQHRINRLTGLLASRNKDCPLASAALEKLKSRMPGFREEQIAPPGDGNHGDVEAAQSSKMVADLLSRDPESQLEFLLTYQGQPGSATESRDEFVAKVGSACAQNPKWAINLFEVLAKQENWTTDLWRGAFWHLRLSAVPPEKLEWLLDIFEKHFAKSPDLRGLTFFLFNHIEFTEQKAPVKETLQKLIRISLNIWDQIRAAEPPRNDEFEATEWTNEAINRTAGQISEFWLKAWSYLRLQSGGTPGGWPEWLKTPLEDIATGGSYAAQLGRVILGYQMPFVHSLDGAWARARLFPKFVFSVAGEEAFLLWEPHLTCGRLYRDLVIEMLPIYRQAFSRFRTVRDNLAVHFYRHVGIIICSCLVNVNEDGWLKEFLCGLTEAQRATWANQMEYLLRDLPNERKQMIWDKWMNDYWRNRLHGKPCKLESKEAGEMLEWAMAMEPAFPAAVEFVTQGPMVDNRFGTVLYHLERGNLIQSQPEAVIRLLKWLLTNSKEQFVSGDDMRKALMRLPKKKAFARELTIICDQLAQHGYSKAPDLRSEIERMFTQA